MPVAGSPMPGIPRPGGRAPCCVRIPFPSGLSITPAVEKARLSHPELEGKALVPEAVKENVWQSIDDLFKTSQAVRTRVKSGKLRVVGAVYQLHSGEVVWLGDHPEQTRLLEYGDGEHGAGTGH